ncbi:ADP-ribosylglycohydrolase family protein [Carboxylicivirga sp. M1479]|uniref:ADP-ribosylglycohydrolase family protein n=1 Tax=Carboxylicivirga sp. M1479 TaxID=2594476 RepID=UPI00163D508D|nr:ADP-ribosylglycohydrolase family protein [Carboxylicivirga sp. M1479]
MMRFSSMLLLALVFIACKHEKNDNDAQLIKVKDYENAVYASWIGQIIGNTYGLGYEFTFIDEPGPDVFPYGYGFTLADLREHNGAYSDDDTDIEYMYLTQMEKNGIEPIYFHLAEAWKAHVKERVWFANRMAVTLMHAGHYPPITGHKDFNSEWFQIDPQLVNEIWAVTAPGMVDYAVAKSEFAARITSNDFGLEPTLHYAAMYSAAFFEKDINRLIEIGNQALSPKSHFVNAVEFVKNQYGQYPNDWQQARKNVCAKYYVVEDYNRHSWAAVDATLNGALGIMALLYGQGDFQNTLDYACAFGMDADNQAATMCGLLGIVNGFESIPKELMFPLDDVDWDLPFNDSYKMITREGLSDITIRELSKRTAVQGEKIILAHGGQRFEKDGEAFYSVPTKAVFSAPFELNAIPKMPLKKSEYFYYPIHTGRKDADIDITIDGQLPDGIQLTDNALLGTPTESGVYRFAIIARDKLQERRIDVELHVLAENMAYGANGMVFNQNSIDDQIAVIRDGDVGTSYMSLKGNQRREIDYYGYTWQDEQLISSLIYNNGKPNEFYGWFTTFDVEYLKNGKWVKLEKFTMSPDLNIDNSQWLKPAYQDYYIEFESITTKGIRIIGLSGGIEKDANNAHRGIEYATSIGELGVY